jgi:hypothetical protein
VLEQRLRLQERRAQREQAEELLHGIGARGDQVPCKVETLAEDFLGVRANECGGEAGRICRAVDRADRCAGDEGRANAEFVEGLQNEDMCEPARAAAAEREPDVRLPWNGNRQL